MLLLSFLKGTGPVCWVEVAQSEEATNSRVYLPACVLDYRSECNWGRALSIPACYGSALCNQPTKCRNAHMCTRLQEVRSESMSLGCVNLQDLTAVLGLQACDWQIGGQNGKTARKIMDDQDLLPGRTLAPFLSKCQSVLTKGLRTWFWHRSLKTLLT